MARYRKVSIQIWNDEKFRAFPDDSKLLFLFLMTHPHMTAIGGMRATKLGIGSELGWTKERTLKAFAEPLAKGMVWMDEAASCLILPNFIKHNEPENPNVIKGWPGAGELIPDCEIKHQLVLRLGEYISKALTEPFRKAFESVSPTLSKGYANTGTGAGTGAGTDGNSAPGGAPPETLSPEDPPTPPEDPPPPLLELGEFKRARMTEEQAEKLIALLGSEFENYIGRFDRWVNDAPRAKHHGVKREDRHAYESIRQWYDRDLKEGKVRGTHQQNQIRNQHNGAAATGGLTKAEQHQQRVLAEARDYLAARTGGNVPDA